MADFDPAIDVVLAHEGGYSCDESDRGGATKYGVTLRSFREWAGDAHTVDDLRSMTREDAAAYYRVCWWDRYGLDRIVHQDVATKLLDVAVNVGPVRAFRFAQEVAGAKQDGVLGPRTVAAVNGCEPRPFLLAYCRAQRSYYEAIVHHDPTQARFAKGWARRAAWPFNAEAVA